MLFYATGVVFWIIFSIALLLLFISVINESLTWSAIIIIAFFTVLWFAGYRENVRGTWEYISHNPVTSSFYFVGYIILGLVYSFIEWYFVLIDHRREGNSRPPQISHYKETLFSWIFYWPINLIWNLIDRPFRKLFNFLYDRIAGGYQRMANKMFPPEQGR